jgi:predicted nucleic acid-binding protein
MGLTLVDTNVLLDVIQDDPHWFEWSATQIESARRKGKLLTNPIIYAELAQRYPTRAQVDQTVKLFELTWQEFDRDSLYLAAQAYGVYRNRGGSKNNVLADFFIGAQAQSKACPLLTRDATRYRTYFPDVELICPGIN